MLQAVTFRVNAPSSSVSIRLQSDGHWFACNNQDGSVRCDTPNYPASAVERLEVSAA